jgi:hypothetical protein
VSTIADLRDLFLLIATDFGLMLTREDAGDEPVASAAISVEHSAMLGFQPPSDRGATNSGRLYA